MLTKLLPPLAIPSLSVAACLALITPCLAQVNPNSTNTDSFQSNEYDPATGSSGLNPLDLIHRATMGNIRSPEEFREDSNENINNAANDFKQQQQELLNNQNPE